MAIVHGFDRADGVPITVGGQTLTIGTPTPANSINVASSNGASSLDNIQVEEDPNSPEIERAEQATFTHTFTMSWGQAINELTYLNRGSIWQDSNGLWFKVLSTRLSRIRPGYARLVVTSESISFDSPPDEFQIIPVELGINILKHPRYFTALFGSGYSSATAQTNQTIIRLLQDYMANTDYAFRTAVSDLFKDSLAGGGTPGYPTYNKKTESFPAGTKITGTEMGLAAALEIVQKWWLGIETPYIIGYQITWASYHFRPPYLHPGGIIEDPTTATPQLPDYFWAYPANPAERFEMGRVNGTIFDWIASYNPQCYSSDGTIDGDPVISWLRKADEIEYARTWFRVTRTWLGAPIGHWDYDIFSGGERPQNKDQFTQYV